MNGNGGTMDRETLIAGKVRAGQSVPDAMHAALADAIEGCVKREADARYAYEQFPGPSTEAGQHAAQKATLRARANLRAHVLDVELREGKRL